MIPVIVILGLMFFTWTVAIYATNREEARPKVPVMPESEKAA